MENAETFLDHWERAAALAKSQGVPLTFSGSRLHEVHGPYCNVFRNVLNLVPEGGATACFAATGKAGRYRITKKEGFLIDFRKVRRLQSALSRHPEQCLHCFNHFHCVGLCPDVCTMDGNNENYFGSFRCRLHLLSAVRQIMKLALEIENGTESFSWREINREVKFK